MISYSRILKSFAWLVCSLLILHPAVHAQLTIQGPQCVLPGFNYQYTITGNWGSDSSAQICIDGGTIDTTADSCWQGGPTGLFKVTWDSSATAGAIHLSAGTDSIIQNIQITSALTPGQIDSTDNFQLIGYDSIPDTIHCTAPTGGNCSPSYNYQWQTSLDDVHWSDIAGATEENIDFSTPLLQTTFYRRKVTETNSGSIVYCLSATVFVKAPPEGTGQ
jgi:hypothetical protein